MKRYFIVFALLALIAVSALLVACDKPQATKVLVNLTPAAGAQTKTPTPVKVAVAVPTVQPTVIAPAVSTPAPTLNTLSSGGVDIVKQNWNGNVPSYLHYRSTVKMPGDVTQYTLVFEKSAAIVLTRVVPDDTLLSAKFYSGTQTYDLLANLGMGPVTSTAPTDANLRAALKKRGVNVTLGEILSQNYNQIDLGTVPAGSYIIFEVKDKEELAINRGLDVGLGDAIDAYTYNLSGAKVAFVGPTSAPTVRAAATTVAPVGPTAAPAPAQTFAQWAGNFQTDRATPVNTVNLNLTSTGAKIAFTIDGWDINNVFVAAQFAGVFLDCKRIDPSQTAEKLPLFVCRRGDGSAFTPGMVTINGSNLFQVWPQKSAPIPAGWTTASVPNPIKLVGGAVAPKVVAAPLSPRHDVGLKSGMGVTKATPVKGQTYCQATHVEFVSTTNDNDIKFAQGRATLYVYVHDAAGNIRKDLPTIFKWADGQDPKTLEPRDMSDTYLRDHAVAMGHTWIPNPDKYTIDYGLYAAYPSYSIQIGGVASDTVYGLGLDNAKYHAANIVEFTCK